MWSRKEIKKDRCCQLLYCECSERRNLIKVGEWVIDYHRNYSQVVLILLFFNYAVFGWMWEVVVGYLYSGSFVNRGVLYGPWLPIYGFGGILTLVLFKRWMDKPVTMFFFVVLSSAVMEYSTSCFLEAFLGAKWWDYSDYIFNLHGRICLEGLLLFGIGGCLSIYFMAPLLDEISRKISSKVKITLCLLLILFFSADLIYSVRNPNQGEGINREVREYRRDVASKEA